MSSGGVTPGPAPRQARTYYRGPDAVVTSELIASGGRIFRLAELSQLRRVRVRTASERVVSAAMWTVLCLGVATVVLAYLRAGIGLALGMAGLTAFTEAVLSAVRAGTDHRWELHGTYGGQQFVIYSAADPRLFALVTRAVLRATENRW